MAEKKKYPFWETFFKREWSYSTGAVLLSVLAIALVSVTGVQWGVTGAFTLWGGRVLHWFGMSGEKLKEIAALNADTFKFWNNQVSITDLGIIVGAFIATLLAAQFKIKGIKSYKNVLAAIIGGLLMGIGARLSYGCNIGGLFSALPAFSLHGWLFWIALFGGAILGSKLLVKYFL